MINNKPIGIFLTMHQLMSSPNGTQPKSLEVPFSQQAVEFTRDTDAYNGLQPEQQATMLHLWTRIRFGLEQLSQMIEDHCPDGAAKLHLAAYRVGFYSDFVRKMRIPRTSKDCLGFYLQAAASAADS